MQDNNLNIDEVKNDNNFSESDILSNVRKLKPYLSILWIQRWLIVKIHILLSLVIITLLFIFAKPYYDSTIVVLPDFGGSGSMLSGFSELASLAGVNVPTRPTDIYAELIKGESVLGPVIYTRYKTDEFPDSVNLIEYFKIEPKDDDDSLVLQRRMFLQCYNILSKYNIKTTVNNLTAILELKVTMPESRLSASVANNIVSSLDSYMRTKRKSQALNKKNYVEKRIEQVRDSLRDAEDALKDFQKKNKIIGQSPDLLLEQKRIQRSLQILENTYMQLSQQLEIVKIEEIRDTPVINIKELAQDPIEKTGPRRIVLFALIMGLLSIVTLVYILFKTQIKDFIRQTFQILSQS